MLYPHGGAGAEDHGCGGDGGRGEEDDEAVAVAVRVVGGLCLWNWSFGGAARGEAKEMAGTTVVRPRGARADRWNTEAGWWAAEWEKRWTCRTPIENYVPFL